MNVFFGIDCGKTGGVAGVDENGNLVQFSKMPLIGKTFDYLRYISMMAALRRSYTESGNSVQRLYVEVTFLQPGKSKGGSDFLKVCGANYAGAYLLAGVAVHIIKADDWRKSVGLVQYGTENTWEKAAREACQRLFPRDPEIAKHEGLADAALMALAALQDWKRSYRTA